MKHPTVSSWIIIASLLALPAAAIAQEQPDSSDDSSDEEGQEPSAGDEAGDDDSSEAPDEGEEAGEPAADDDAEPAADDDAEPAADETDEAPADEDAEPAVDEAPEPEPEAGADALAEPGDGAAEGDGAESGTELGGAGGRAEAGASLEADLEAAREEEQGEPADAPAEAAAGAAAGEGKKKTRKDGRVFDPNLGRFVDKSEQVPWRGSTFTWTHMMSPHTLNPNRGLSKNPTYVQRFSIRPQWHFNDHLLLRASQLVDVELTDTDSRARNRDIAPWDTFVDLVRVTPLPWDFNILLGGRLVLPASKASRAQKLYMGTGAFGALTRVFPEVLAGLAVQLSGSFNHYWTGSNVTTTESSYPCQRTDAEVAQMCSQAGGLSSVRNLATGFISAQLEVVSGVTLATSFGGWWRKGYGLATAEVETLDGTQTLEDESKTHWRNQTMFSLSAAWDPNTWLRIFGGLWTFTANLNPDGSRRNPFYHFSDTRIQLGTTILADQLYFAIKRMGED